MTTPAKLFNSYPLVRGGFTEIAVWQRALPMYTPMFVSVTTESQMDAPNCIPAGSTVQVGGNVRGKAGATPSTIAR